MRTSRASTTVSRLTTKVSSPLVTFKTAISTAKSTTTPANTNTEVLVSVKPFSTSQTSKKDMSSSTTSILNSDKTIESNIGTVDLVSTTITATTHTSKISNGHTQATPEEQVTNIGRDYAIS